MNIHIRSTGRYLPDQVITNADLETELGRALHNITQKNGVETRYRSSILHGETSAQMCAWAAQDALTNGNMSPGDLDLIIFASASPQQAIPDTAALVQGKLGLGQSGIRCFSVHTTCLSFLTALDIASSLIHSKSHCNILIVCAERSFTSLNPADPVTYTLFGDGAAAAIITPTPVHSSSQILRSHFSTFGDYAQLTTLPGCGTRYHPNHPDTRFEHNTFQMKGRELLRFSLKNAPSILENIWPGLSQSTHSFDRIIPHQPSKVGLRVLERYFPREKTIETLSHYGNCVSVSIPLSLDEAIRNHNLQRGEQVLLFGTGAGLNIAGISLIY